MRNARPIVIAHRGASGYRPEHTLAAYELAIDQGADFIEPDLVSTKDGVLVARHENAIAIVDPSTGQLREATTDVMDHPELSRRQATKVIDGVSITGWFTEDFTLEELKKLRAKERLPQLRPRNTIYDGLYDIPTLQEVIDLARRKSAELGRTIGIYPETKHPTYFDSVTLSLEESLVRALEENGYRGHDAPVYIQSFEVGNLQKLRHMTRVPLVQLLDSTGQPFDFVLRGDRRAYADMATPPGLDEISQYADGIGPDKNYIIPRDESNRLRSPTGLVHRAHARGLAVHAWAFRNENYFLPNDYRIGTDPRDHGDAEAEYERFFETGIDGLFSDNPDTAVSVRDRSMKNGK